MANTIRITELKIHSPPERVRAQYRDIDHHIRARQVMKKALAEDKRDLEQGEFRAGAAAGNVAGALNSLAAQSPAPSAVKYAILRAAALIATCDGSVDDAERDALRHAALLLGADAGESAVDAMLSRCSKLAASERIQTELDRVGSELALAGVAREGLVAAAVVALVSEGMSLGELEALRRLANAAGFAEDALGPLIDLLDSTLSTV